MEDQKSLPAGRQGISTLAGIIIIIIFAILLFGGVFAYEHFAVKIQPIVQPQNKVQNQINKDDSHNTSHVYSEETKIDGKDSFSSEVFTKNIVWPKFRNISDANVLAKINQLLSFNNVTGYNLDDKELKTSSGGLTDVNYQINYDKSNILNITFITDFMGAYPSESIKSYSINLVNGEFIKPSDIFYHSKISGLLNILNSKLQDNIKQELILVGKNNQSDQSDECSVQDVTNSLKQAGEFDKNYAKFTEENIAGYKITSSGVEFTYNFDFPHVTQACEPNGTIFFTYDQLKDYIRSDGLLSGESNQTFNWEGNYSFSEFSQPNQTWEYSLSISSADGKLHVGLNIDGFQTMSRIIATANNNGSNLDVIFDSYSSENIGGNLKKGYVLFTLTPASDGLSVQWNKMQPNLKDNINSAIFKKVSK